MLLSNWVTLEEVREFTHLSSVIITKVNCKQEITQRLSTAKSSIQDMINIWKSKAISNNPKLRIIRATACAIAIYTDVSRAMTKRGEGGRRIRSAGIQTLAQKILSTDQTARETQHQDDAPWADSQREDDLLQATLFFTMA